MNDEIAKIGGVSGLRVGSHLGAEFGCLFGFSRLAGKARKPAAVSFFGQRSAESPRPAHHASHAEPWLGALPPGHTWKASPAAAGWGGMCFGKARRGGGEACALPSRCDSVARLG